MRNKQVHEVRHLAETTPAPTLQVRQAMIHAQTPSIFFAVSGGPIQGWAQRIRLGWPIDVLELPQDIVQIRVAGFSGSQA